MRHTQRKTWNIHKGYTCYNETSRITYHLSFVSVIDRRSKLIIHSTSVMYMKTSIEQEDFRLQSIMKWICPKVSPIPNFAGCYCIWSHDIHYSQDFILHKSHWSQDCY